MIYQSIQNKANAASEAIIYGSGRISYAKLQDEIHRRAAYFKDLPQTFILAHTNELENLLNFLTLMSLGKRSVFASRNVSDEQRLKLARELDARIVTEDITGDDRLDMLDYQPKDKDIFLGVLSSGTTGIPKVIWKDYGAWFSAFSHQSEVFGINSEDKVFVLDALSYSANLNSALHALWLGATLVMGSLKNARKWPELFEKEQVSSVFMVPSHYRLLADQSPDLPQLRSLVSAGEKLDPQTASRLLELFPASILTEYYGAAELGHIAYHQNQDIIDKPAEVGKPFPGVEIRIENQLIKVSSPYVSPDYRHDATVRDLGFVEDGRLVVLGREGRMFNRRGMNIFAEEIENAALQFPMISEVAVVQKKISDNKYNLLLYFSGHDKQSIQTQDLRAFLLRVLPKEKLPNAFIELDELPHQLSGKIDFNALSKRPVEEDSIA